MIRPTESVLANEVTSPDELIKVLKRNLRESNQSERAVASRIGVNQPHPSSLAHDQPQPDARKVGVSRVLPQACVGYL